jgi:hypothetical protein
MLCYGWLLDDVLDIHWSLLYTVYLLPLPTPLPVTQRATGGKNIRMPAPRRGCSVPSSSHLRLGASVPLVFCRFCHLMPPGCRSYKFSEVHNLVWRPDNPNDLRYEDLWSDYVPTRVCTSLLERAYALSFRSFRAFAGITILAPELGKDSSSP